MTSLMTWLFVAPTEEAYVEALRRAHALDPTAGPFEAYRGDIEPDCITGRRGRRSRGCARTPRPACSGSS